MKTYNLYTLIIKFFKNTPIITLLSFVLIVFTAVLTTFFPKYSSIFVSEIYRMDTDIFSNELIKLVSIYLFIWLGVLIHFYIIHTKLLVKSRSFFLEELFIPIWNKLEKGELPQNSTSTIIKNIFTIVTNNTILIQGLIFITIPAICSMLLFMFYLPNIWSLKITITITFLILFFLVYSYSSKIKLFSAERLNQTNTILELIEDDIHNNLNIMNFNTFKKELRFFKKNCKKQELSCYKNGKVQVMLNFWFLIIIITGLITPVLFCYKKMKIDEFKKFIVIYIPMVISIISVFYGNLSKIIVVMQAYGNIKSNIDTINNYIINDKIYNKENNKHSNKNLNMVNINLSFGKNTIFKNTTIQFNKGVTLIKGNSGEGKSSILKMIFGITNYDSGDIFYKNISKNDSSINKWRDNIFYISQFPSFFNNRQLKENLYYGDCENSICNAQNIDYVANKFGLSEKIKYLLENSNTYSLSGGEKQIITIIKSFVTDKNIYLFDEPTASLDLNKSNIVYAIIQELKIKNKIVIIVSHDKSFELIADKVIDIAELKQ